MSFQKKLTKEKLTKELKAHDKLKDCANYLSVSQQSLIKWIKDYGLYKEFNFKRNIGQGKPWLGKHLSNETKQKISKTKQGKPGHGKLTRIEVVCKICSKKYENVPEAKGSLNKQTCSFECKNKLHSMRMKQEIKNNKKCLCCGIRFYRPKSQDHIKFCSYDCVFQYKRENINLDVLNGWNSYNNSVRRLTEINYKKYKNEINPENLLRGRGKWHLDHKVSVKNGFNNKVPVEIMADKINLEMIKAKENLTKHTTSSISIENLMENYNSVRI